LAVYNNEFMLDSACVGSLSHRTSTRLTVWSVLQEQVYRTKNSDVDRRWTETTHPQRVGRSESRGYWTCCWRVASASTRLHSCWRRTFWVHAV